MTVKHNRVWSILHSIRFRLTLWTAAILAVILVSFSGFVYVRISRDLQADAQNRLEVKAQQMQLFLRVGGLLNPDREGSPGATSVPIMPTLSTNQVLAIVNRDGSLQTSQGGITNQEISQLTSAWQQVAENMSVLPQGLFQVGSGGKNGLTKYAYLVEPMLVDRRLAGWLILGEPADPTGQLPRLVITLLLGSLATLAFALGGGYWLASRAMAPVRLITRTARGISETDLHQRLNLGTSDELGELADTFDAMLARLQAAFDRQRQFTADASHELRTPLTIVGLEAEHALARARSHEEYERTLKIIQSENEFMSRLVNDLLTLARMDAGQTQLRPEPVDLSDTALDVIDRLESLARRDGVELLTGDLPEVLVKADRMYLNQMLINLVENAMKYSGGAGHHVRVETGYRTEEKNTWAWVRVEDDGPGIPMDDLPHLFDRFYRVDKARTRSEADTLSGDAGQPPEGSGLGLSIVQWIAQAHLGKVAVSNLPGKGAAFEVLLPASVAHEETRRSTINHEIHEQHEQNQII